ncbi:MAG: cbb3-type cytochrome c oxidase subunit 3 [Gammaproteobacteria bacterium]|nr:cbb3-type cytochrome c oxidase subunit 3 [Gammaproteobacteria bacterium]
MDITLIQSIWTVVAFITFIVIVLWAWSSHRKQAFEDAARLPFEEDEHMTPSGENRHG